MKYRLKKRFYLCDGDFLEKGSELFNSNDINKYFHKNTAWFDKEFVESNTAFFEKVKEDILFQIIGEFKKPLTQNRRKNIVDKLKKLKSQLKEDKKKIEYLKPILTLNDHERGIINKLNLMNIAQ